MSKEHRSIPPKKRTNILVIISAVASIIAAVADYAGAPYSAKGGAGAAAILLSTPLTIMAGLLIVIALVWARHEKRNIFYAAVLCFVAISANLHLLTAIREGTNWQRCPANLNHIGLGILIYAKDHNDQLPSSLEEMIVAEDMSPEVLICPSTRDKAATGKTIPLAEELKQRGHCSYTYIGAGHRSNELTFEDVLAFDCEPVHEGYDVLFGDGHTEWLGTDDFQQRLARTREHLATQPTTVPTTRADSYRADRAR